VFLSFCLTPFLRLPLPFREFRASNVSYFPRPKAPKRTLFTPHFAVRLCSSPSPHPLFPQIFLTNMYGVFELRVVRAPFSAPVSPPVFSFFLFETRYVRPLSPRNLSLPPPFLPGPCSRRLSRYHIPLFPDKSLRFVNPPKLMVGWRHPAPSFEGSFLLRDCFFLFPKTVTIFFYPRL